MMLEASKFNIRGPKGESIANAEEAVTSMTHVLEDTGWRGQQGGVGDALVNLFGRFVELIFNRLNRVPQKAFLAFLNGAGLKLLPPRAASAVVKLVPDPGAVDFIRVPSGTQVATVKSEDQPEIIFETERDVVLTTATLLRCISFDSLAYSDNTLIARAEVDGVFGAFEGREERPRRLYIGDSELLAFSDESIKRAAVVTFQFVVAKGGDPDSDGWVLSWLYWNGEQWASLVDAGAYVDDGTDGFKKSGAVIIGRLPELFETQIGGETARWFACDLKGGSARRHLPVISDVTITLSIQLTPVWAPPDALFNVIQAGTIFTPLDPQAEFFPLGQRPSRLDTFYIRSDVAFSKPGARVEISVEEIGLPDLIGDATDIDALELEWEYYSTEAWRKLGKSTRTGSTPERLNFTDATKAFTVSGENLIIGFDVPQESEGEDQEKPFATVKVNGVEGYWIRARVKFGSYDEPGGMKSLGEGQYEWVAPKSHPPLIKHLALRYTGFSVPDVGPIRVQHCRSEIDGTGYNQLPLLLAQRPFTPFGAVEEGSAMYLGFDRSFPHGEWMQLLLDVPPSAVPTVQAPLVSWEYWNGEWTALRVSDGSRGLSVRGYLGFFAPGDQRAHEAFSQSAYWLRAYPHRAPVANAGPDQPRIIASNGKASVTLTALGSGARGRQEIRRYIWRLRSSSAAPVAEVIDKVKTVSTSGREVKVEIDASPSRASGNRVIVKYIVRRFGQDQAELVPTTVMPYIRRIITNAVPVQNAETIRNEVLGSSDDKPNQRFSVLRTPILPGGRLAVREPDRPPQEELSVLGTELRADDPHAEVLVDSAQPSPGEGVWVRWHLVDDFHGSSPSSRHFTLDPISGEIGFGDGKRGKIPPVGRNNIMVLQYRTHSSGQGNVPAGAITVLRNPSGELANIKRLANFEASAGGSQAENIDSVKLRGPQTLKHRERAVTCEDFEWLAKEATAEVAQARCLAVRNRLGTPEPGWITVVITPQSSVTKPIPNTTLLRTVQNYLEQRALTNLQAGKQIHVKGPEYIETTVMADVVAKEPEKADEIELAIIQRLETFLHPLQGGPQRSGWDLGRDVYISEIYTEVEAVEGVDYVSRLSLQASLQQYRIELESNRPIPFDVPQGSQVASFDERIKLVLATLLPKTREGEETPTTWHISVHGFKVGDRVVIVASDNSIIEQNLTIVAFDGDRVIFSEPFVPSIVDWERRDGLASEDLGLRLPLQRDGALTDHAGRILGLNILFFEQGQRLSIGAGGKRDPRMEFLPITHVENSTNRVFVPQGHLVYSGRHDIEMVLE